MPVDKFGRMSDTKTKDTGVSLTYINNNYIRSDGSNPISGSLNMNGNNLYNVIDPVNPQDVATKEYVDNTKGSAIIGKKINNAVSIKESLDFTGKHKMKNLPEPVDDGDAVNKKYVDDVIQKQFIDENDNIVFGRDINMESKKIFSLPEPMQGDEPATKKYVDDLQTQYIDQKGNIKFNRNINVSNQRIFALKEPKKPYEAANKKYVDDNINKRIEEEKDKFLPQDPVTKQYVDEAIKDLVGGDTLVSKEGVFSKVNGYYRATAPLDIDTHKMKNLPEPVDDGDAVNKKYVDDIAKTLTSEEGLLKENGGYNIVGASYINMNFNTIKNVGLPVHESDATAKNYVDKEIKDNIVGVVVNQLKELNQLVGISAMFNGDLVEGDYPFTFGGSSQTKNKSFKKYNGFLVPTFGVIKHFAIKPMGLKLAYPKGKDGEITKNLIKKYGLEDNPTPLYTLVLVKSDNDDVKDIGTMFFYFTNFTNIRLTDNRRIQGKVDIKFQFKPESEYLRKDENFLCSVNEGDIIDIRSEFTEEKGEFDKWALPIPFKDIYKHYLDIRIGDESFLHLATLTFLFKEMSFPNILELEPLDN